MAVSVKVAGNLTPRKLEELLEPLVFGTADEDALILDLRRISWASPFAFVTLVTILDNVYATAGGVRLVCPEHGGCRQYFSSSGFLQQLPGEIDIVGDDSFRGARPSDADTLLSLTRLDSREDIHGALAAVGSRLDRMLGGGDPEWRRTKGAVLDTLGELCVNIFQHAECRAGWVSAQKYYNRFQGRHWVEIGIGDAGRGIRRSLATTYPDIGLLGDGESIERALMDGLSRLSTPDRCRGTGFQVLQKATREHDGSFYMRSGTGAVVRERHRRALQRQDQLAPWPGTQLRVTLTCG